MLNPIKHGRNYFVRRLHYAAGEVRSYTLYFPMHRTHWQKKTNGMGPGRSIETDLLLTTEE